MAQDPPNLPSALLSWLRALAGAQIPSLSSLRDGHVLWALLLDIDPEYFSADTLPSSPSETASNWIPRWQNLKHIEKEVSGYVRDVCGVETGLGAEMGGGDLKKIAQGQGQDGEEDLIVLLKGILRAAMYSPRSNQRMGRVVVGLGAETAGIIAATMAAMEEGYAGEDVEEEEDGRDGEAQDEDVFNVQVEHNSPAKGKGVDKGKEAERDLELEHEEKLIHAHRIIRQLEESNAKAAAELEDLRQEKARIEEAFDKLREDPSSGGGKKREDEALRELRDRSDEDRDYIAQIETELEAARTTAQSQERQLERLKLSGEAQQKLKDDLQLLRAERDDLLSKTRANENLRKKIQNLQDESKGSVTLREDLKNAQDQLAEMEKWKDRCEKLETSNRENMNIIANAEQEIFDMRTARKRLEHELRVLSQRYDVVRERQARDQEVIQDLETKLAGMERGEAEVNGAQGLDSEMDKADRRPPTSRKVSIALPGTGDVAMLEDRLRSLTLRNKSLEEQYLDILSDKLGLETTLGDLNEGTEGNGEEKIPYLEQRKKLMAATEEVRKLQESVYEMTSELASTKEKLLSIQEEAKSGLKSPTSDDESRRLDAGAEYAALSRSYGNLTKHSENLQAELAESKALLRYALLSARGIGMEDEELRRSKEWELVKQLLDEVMRADNDEVVVDVSNRLVSRIEESRSDGKKAAKELEQKEAELLALRKQLEEAQQMHRQELDAAREQASKSGTGLTKEDEKAMAQLRRENQLMTSAWFDLTSRIQRDNVIVGRRRESPKSWLGKQRAAVGLGVTGMGSR
ncbi:Protein Hook 2 [Sphaceloma murrayae]|uniref:Protein Hook 2 n=1 Tax=Sphaceloma murrayae TaxID=2082308 RepID=A0A2K1QHS7_9PEZI|nr:Protein Hook 2 [Sphaceloma murrayae]